MCRGECSFTSTLEAFFRRVTFLNVGIKVTEPLVVLYLNFEIGEPSIMERIQELAKGGLVSPNFHFKTLLGCDVPLLDTTEGAERLWGRMDLMDTKVR